MNSRPAAPDALELLDLVPPGASGLGAVCTTRRGGASRGAYSTLNLGLHVGDAPQDVLENRRRLAAALGLDARAFVCAAQVHRGGVAVVGAAERGRGALAAEDALPDLDGLVTAEPGLPLLVFAADCLLLVLAGPADGAADGAATAVAAVHASWRSVAAGIVGAAVRRLADDCGLPPTRLAARGSPHLGECCYEVREDMRADFFAARPELLPERAELFPERGGRMVFRLGEAVRRELLRAGLREARIALSRDCTACDAARCFSHRRERRPSGRMALAVWLKPRRDLKSQI